MATNMGCIFCRTEHNLTDERVFPAFMGGELEVRNGSCETHNGKFAVDEATLKDATTPLLNLLQIENRYGVVPNAPLKAKVHGLDLRSLPAFMDGAGEIRLQNTVKETVTEEGRRLRTIARDRRDVILTFSSHYSLLRIPLPIRKLLPQRNLLELPY
jgi:hypothetical protein